MAADLILGGHPRRSADPEAMLAKKARGQEAKLSYAGHVLMENRNGLILDLLVTAATGTAERDGALVLLDRRRLPRKRVTLADSFARQSQLSTRLLLLVNNISHTPTPRRAQHPVRA